MKRNVPFNLCSNYLLEAFWWFHWNLRGLWLCPSWHYACLSMLALSIPQLVLSVVKESCFCFCFFSFFHGPRPGPCHSLGSHCLCSPIFECETCNCSEHFQLNFIFSFHSSVSFFSFFDLPNHFSPSTCFPITNIPIKAEMPIYTLCLNNAP